MQISNAYNLPAPIVRAIERDTYSSGGSDISVTQLIAPPRIVQLRKRHRSEIQNDVTDMLWLLLGQAMHHILERGVNLLDPEIAEARVFTEIEGWKVSGQNDLWTPPDLLSDYKCTSTWAFILSDKPDWEAQLNCLAYLYRSIGFAVNKLQIVAIYRDFSKGKAKQGGNYPKIGAGIHPVKVWPNDECLRFMTERVKIHQAAADLPDDQLPLCSPEDRWEKETTYAVMKKGNKSASKVCSSLNDAHQAIINYTYNKTKAPEYYVQTRPGESIRCLDYCEVAPWCNQRQESAA